MSTNAKSRLDALQAQLLGRGVRDVKFFFSTDNKTSLTSLANDVGDALEAVLSNEYTTVASNKELLAQ